VGPVCEVQSLSNICLPPWLSWSFMTEPVEATCLSCSAVVTFDKQLGYTTCEGCGAKVYLTSSGQLGVFPREGWKPGGFGRERKKRT